MRPFIEQAFAAEHVTIDFAGFSGETLHGAVQEPLDNIRIGRIKPATLTIRMLLPDTSRPMVLPCRADDLTDDPEHRARARDYRGEAASYLAAVRVLAGGVAGLPGGTGPVVGRGHDGGL